LHNSSRRQALATAAPERHYAFLRAARDGSERLVVVLNFQPQEEAVQLDLSGVDFETATDLESDARNDRESPWRLRLPAYGHRFFRLGNRKGGRA
jgi:hypothetical protein